MRSKEARDKLILDHQGLIAWAIRRLKISERHKDDAKGEAQLALIHAAETWQERTTFVWYAARLIVRRLVVWFQRECDQDAHETTTVEVVGEESAGPGVIPLAKGNRDLIAGLAPELQSVLRRIYFGGKTAREVSIEDGCSEKTIKRLKAAALKAVRDSEN